MPYVPSEKTNPPATDRKELDVVVENLSHLITTGNPSNFSLLERYKKTFVVVSIELQMLYKARPIPDSMDPATVLAVTIHEIGKKYGYEGAFLGELNYAITRLIQRVPQLMVARGWWKETDELRYWLYACTVEALTHAAADTRDYGIGISGVFEDIKDEYKRRVNTAYEAAQIVKSGDCYDTPYYTRLVEVVDENGDRVGFQEVMLKRSEATVGLDVLNGKVVLKLAQ